MKKFLLSFFIMSPFLTLAEGMDKKINDQFMPIATDWENFVLTTINIGGIDIPIVLLILVFGATFFTIYFSFPGLTKFKLAINTVRGKYDDLENHSGEKSNLNVEGDIKGTINDEAKDGEVSHFQALATAVSGTVGLGNIAGVAVAIALGGPGATFDDSLRFNWYVNKIC